MTPSVASHWLPKGINPPCTCNSHAHRSDNDQGGCEASTTNDPESWGICACQHMAAKPVTPDLYKRWQEDIISGPRRPERSPAVQLTARIQDGDGHRVVVTGPRFASVMDWNHSATFSSLLWVDQLVAQRVARTAQSDSSAPM